MILNFIMTLFQLMVAINLLMFLFVLGKKINTVLLERKKELLRDKYEDKLNDYMTQIDDELSITLSTKLERKVFEELFLRYIPILTEKVKQVLTSILGRERVVEGTKRKLNSKNPWVKKIGTFQAGEFGVVEVNTMLLEQLKLKNRELLYVTVRSLIKLGGRENLMSIIDEVGKDNRMEKNNILTLIEMVNQDIRDVLEKMILGSSTILKILALEIYGKRQYIEGVYWIKLMVSNPLKEIRIASLKGACALGDVVDEEYYNRIFALENDTEWEVRAFLARFLESVKTKEAINILSRLIKDSNWYVRKNAAQALGNQGQRGLNSLVGLLDSGDQFARDKSREVIQQGIIHQDILYNLEGDVNNGVLIPKTENGLVKVNGNHE